MDILLREGKMDVSFFIAFTAGLLSFFTPCILPLVPSYLIFISGISYDNYNQEVMKKYRKIVFIHSLSFILGFSFIFVSMGLASSLIGRLFGYYQDLLVKMGGVLLVLMGLSYLNVFRIPFLEKQRGYLINKRPIGLLSSFFVGVTLSLGWTPCVGPALSSILMLTWASDSPYRGLYLLGLYSLGMAIPFILCSLIFHRIFEFIKKYSFISKHTPKILGTLLIIVGFMLITSMFTRIGLILG